MKTFTYKGLPFGINKGRIYCLIPIFLDIETSNNHAEDPSELRCWITSIQILFNGEYHLFRYPEEFVSFYKGLYYKYGLKTNGKFPKVLITYIHNASYDLSYLVPYINQLPDNDNNSQGIIEGPNKFLSYVRGPFEFRCSYRLSGMSLEKWSTEFNIEHKKQIGLYDYEAIIYPDDTLSSDQEKYDKYDVLSMQECLQKQLNFFGDDLTTIPPTKTSYIRRTLRKSCSKDKHYRKDYFLNNRLNASLYLYALRSYAGGITHNNRFYRDTVISGVTIGHRDFKSHYPSQMACRLFGLGIPQKVYDTSMPFPITISEVLSWYPDFSSISVIRMYKADLKDPKISIPFMQFSKCYEGSYDHKMLDNGRILSLSGEWVMYVDDLTLRILDEQYNIDYEILEVYRMANKPLPECILKVVDKYFKGKSDKKNIVHALTEEYGKLHEKTINAEFELMQEKSGLNSIYGCCATNPLRTKYKLTEDLEFKIETIYDNPDVIAEGLDEFYSHHNNFLNYIVGCQITSMARYELYEYIKTIGYDKVLYCDTDSIFYIKDDDTERKITELNRIKREKARCVILDNGKKEYYDEFTSEPDCIAFKGLHAKCYGVVTDKGLELTIAGIPARTLIGLDENNKPIYYTREQELSGTEQDPIKALDKLTDGFEFKINAGVTAIYIGANGKDSYKECTIQNINGHEVHTAGGCVIRKLKSKKIKDMTLTELDENIINDFDITSLE